MNMSKNCVYGASKNSESYDIRFIRTILDWCQRLLNLTGANLITNNKRNRKYWMRLLRLSPTILHSSRKDAPPTWIDSSFEFFISWILRKFTHFGRFIDFPFVSLVIAKPSSQLSGSGRKNFRKILFACVPQNEESR